MWACRWSRTGGWWVTRSARRQKWRNKTTSREVPDIPLANATVTQVMSQRVLPSLLSHKSCLAGRWIWPLSQNIYSFAAHMIFSPAGTVTCQPERWLWKSQSISSLCNTQTSLSGTNNHIQVTYIHRLAMKKKKNIFIWVLFFQLKPPVNTDTQLLFAHGAERSNHCIALFHGQGHYRHFF